jgi:HK97 family phage prohead protease
MKEQRYLGSAEIRASAPNTLVGYSAVFNCPSGDLGGFTETIRPGCFARAIRTGQDVCCLFNHDSAKILGRTTSGTLQLREDSVGLNFECRLADGPTAKDVYAAVQRGDISGCSFAFQAVQDRWVTPTERELIDVDLFDVSPVVYPAYPATSISARALWPDGIPPEIRSHMTGGTITSCFRLALSDAQRLRILAEKLEREGYLPPRTWNAR